MAAICEYHIFNYYMLHCVCDLWGHKAKKWASKIKDHNCKLLKPSFLNHKIQYLQPYVASGLANLEIYWWSVHNQWSLKYDSTNIINLILCFTKLWSKEWNDLGKKQENKSKPSSKKNLFLWKLEKLVIQLVIFL